jgi:hypothetical protein
MQETGNFNSKHYILSLKREREILHQGLHQRSQISALCHGQKDHCRGLTAVLTAVLTVVLTKSFSLGFEIELNVLNLIFLFH